MRPRRRSRARDSSPPMAHSQVKEVPLLVAPFPVLVRSLARAVSRDPADQADRAPPDQADRDPADPGRSQGTSRPPGTDRRPVSRPVPYTRRHPAMPPPAGPPGQAATSAKGRPALTAARARAPVRTAGKGSRLRTTRRDSRLSSAFKGCPAPMACKDSPGRTTRRATPVRTASDHRQIRTPCRGSRVSSAGKDSLGRQAPAKPGRCPPATRRRTGSTTRPAIRGLVALSAPAVLGALQAGMATRGPAGRAGRRAADQGSAGIPTTRTPPLTDTARASTAASTPR
jgi:hypothetical protein